MATAANTVYPHITKYPGVCSGRPCVEGTRVRVVDILALHQAGLTPEQMVKEFPTLSGFARGRPFRMIYWSKNDDRRYTAGQILDAFDELAAQEDDPLRYPIYYLKPGTR